MVASNLVKQVRFGGSGLKISPIIIGCMSYGSKKWADWVLEDKEKIFGILKHAYDRGLRTYDTADVYSNGYSERLLKEFFEKYQIKRETVVIMTKVFFGVDEDLNLHHGLKAYNDHDDLILTNQRGLSRKHILEGVKNSTERLGTYIDVLQIHRLDKETPMKEIMKALNDVVEAGYARYIGSSSMLATEFAELQFIAENHNWFQFVSLQSFYNLLNREDEREIIPFAKRHNIALIPWSPNARGLLTRPLNKTTDRIKSDPTFKYLDLDNLTEDQKEIINRVEEVAKKHNTSMAIISNSWVLSKGCNPIVGLNSIDRVDEAIASIDFELSDEDIKYLEEPYLPKKLYY
ncbi:putative aryl-alcohol dehydrogenase [Nakaseomyces glabratus]|nr:putative aryl-alcohol dehydrogenase [Nakaseomyces glabratus]KTB06222.1 putative aryl-alcohol dehydrogenase [Nakaseomyces glabratus]KTB22078.1 putative aryl-alcohol dehydrogenase [Nakaseomyces glabratus]